MNWDFANAVTIKSSKLKKGSSVVQFFKCGLLLKIWWCECQCSITAKERRSGQSERRKSPESLFCGDHRSEWNMPTVVQSELEQASAHWVYTPLQTAISSRLNANVKFVSPTVLIGSQCKHLCLHLRGWVGQQFWRQFRHCDMASNFNGFLKFKWSFSLLL